MAVVAQVTEVAAERLDPTVLGLPCEVVEAGRDGELRHGFVLKHFVVPAQGPVRLVGEVTTVVVERDVVVRFFTVPVDPGRWTGGGPAGAPVAPPVAAAAPVAQPQSVAQPGGGWGSYGSAAGPEAGGPGAGTAPWLRGASGQ